KPDGSLKAVAARFGELLGQDVALLDNWLDESTATFSDSVAATNKAAKPGSVLLLENKRKYKLETFPWDKTPGQLPPLAAQLATALRKGASELDGQNICLGVAEDPVSADKPIYVPRERVEQAKQMIAEGRAKGIEFILPIDSINQDGRAIDVLGPTGQQFDV